jgi:hypothetical protein
MQDILCTRVLEAKPTGDEWGVQEILGRVRCSGEEGTRIGSFLSRILIGLLFNRSIQQWKKKQLVSISPPPISLNSSIESGRVVGEEVRLTYTDDGHECTIVGNGQEMEERL